ncbi:laminin subunit alpha-3 isoform X3 [Nothobranchius furzeri]|uniref:laminin subunit alpha-3 isoform X3 n=1 Tax=Nothobranchius furzeri TaxID=105023 RepID=UPI002403FFE4|nr:laminin subunit alpha-3 isoform X3 [Nothobranchius furzeri]
MKWKMVLFFILVWPVGSFAPVCLSALEATKSWNHQKENSAETFCDPSFTRKCSSGFYREWTGPLKGQCVPCSCNGLSDVCDDLTGSCLNCQFNATGVHCERCKNGYYGDAANRTCRACPCPFTQNNLALACLEIHSGVVECLCDKGYAGSRCERCAYGYYGNPMVHGGICKPCNCTANSTTACDSLTGKCTTWGQTSCEGDRCAYTQLEDLEKFDADLVWPKQQLQIIAHGSASFHRLHHLEKSISDIEVQVHSDLRLRHLELCPFIKSAGFFMTLSSHHFQVGSFRAAAMQLDPKVELLGPDVDAVRNDLSHQTDLTLDIVTDLGDVLVSLDGSRLWVQDLLSEAAVLLAAVKDLMKQQTLVKSEDTLTENHKIQKMEEALQTTQEIRNRNCTSQRAKVGSEQKKTLILLNRVRNNVTTETLKDDLKRMENSLTEISEHLLNANNTVSKTRGPNMKATQQHLQHALAQLEVEQNMLHPVTVMTHKLLKKITDIFLMLDKFKDELEHLSAQMDGAKLELVKRLNKSFWLMSEGGVAVKAEQHAEEVADVTAELQQAINSADVSGVYNSIIQTLEEAELKANWSGGAADQILEDVKEGRLNMNAEEMEDKSGHLQTEANNTLDSFRLGSRFVNTLNNRVNKQRQKRTLMKEVMLTLKEDIKQIRRDEAGVFAESVRTATSTANSRISNVKEKLSDISFEVARLSNIGVDRDGVLAGADQALKSFNRELPVLSAKLKQISALSRKTPPAANITESIRRINDVIDETRNLVNRLSVATTFNGKAHVELHPPRNLEDIKAFTVVDLLLNRHANKPAVTDERRKRRQNKHRDENLFVLYLGNKDAFGDYIGMAIRNTVLICVYKLGGVLHEIQSSQIRTSNVSSSNFDRVTFQRVYQDAEVRITQNFTLKDPVSLPPKLKQPNTMSGVFSLDPETAVFYVGGYPSDFVPPKELRYTKYRGAMKLSYINDYPVSLYNFKHAENMDAQQPAVLVPQQDVSDYYDGTGYSMALIKEPNRKSQLFKFHTHSPGTDAFLFFTENEESYFCVFLERGFLVLRGRQANKELRVQSPDQVSLSDQQFAVSIADRFVVRYGTKQISADNAGTNFRRFYMGGLPAWLRQRHNLTVTSFRGCVGRLTANAETGMRAAALYSSLPVDFLFVLNQEPIRVSLGFRSFSRHAVLLSSISEGSSSAHDLQLSLADGFILFRRHNSTLVSDKRYSDGAWHHLSAEAGPKGLRLNIDNVNVLQERPSRVNLQGGKFKGCISNVYSWRPEQRLTPADLSVLSQTTDIIPGWCGLHLFSQEEFLTEPGSEKPQKHKPIKPITGSRCRRRQNQHEYKFSEAKSWLSYTVPKERLNYRPHFSLHIKTASSKGLILHVEGGGMVPLLALYVANGKIRLSLGHNRTIQHKQKTNDGNWHMAEFSVEKNHFHLLVDGIRVTDGILPNNEGSSLQLNNPVYLGGDPRRTIKVRPKLREHNIPMDGIIGCMREFRMNDVAVGEPDSSHKMLPCFGGLSEMGTYFGGGHIVSDETLTVGSDLLLSFELRPQHMTGLLFHFKGDKNSLNVYLLKNKVFVDLNDVRVTVTPHKSLCDGKFHKVTVSKQETVIQLVVDSISERKVSLSLSNPRAQYSLNIGGMTNRGSPVSPPFIGCLRNVTLENKPVAFQRGFRVFGFVNINRCPAD